MDSFLAYLSGLAYKEPETVIAHCDRHGLSKCTILEAGSSQGFVTSNQNMTVVVFRGTEVTSLLDWCTDIKCVRMKYQVGKIHSGFGRAFADISPVLWEALKQHPSPRLYCTGHSLGAALATVASAELVKQDRALTSLVTFGSPRVGNYTFARHLNHCVRIRRYVNNNDAVTKVPMAGYYHVGRMYYFDTGGRLYINPNWLFVGCDRLYGRFRDIGKAGTDGIKDHSIGTYHSLVSESEADEVRDRDPVVRTDKLVFPGPGTKCSRPGRD